MKDIRDFSILLSIFIFIYALLGMELFGFKVAYEAGEDRPILNYTPSVDAEGRLANMDAVSFPDSTFNTIVEALASVFICMANDGWSTIYIMHSRALGSVLCTFFFVSLLFVGQFFLLNLFLANLIRNFDEQSLEQKHEEQQEAESAGDERADAIETQSEQAEQDWFFRALSCVTEGASATWEWLNVACQRRNCIAEESDDDLSGNSQSIRSLEGSIDEESDLPETHSLLLFSSKGDFRRTTTWLVQSEYFENFMMILIVASSVLLAWEKPLIDPRSDLAIGIGWAAETLNAIFVAEAVLKIIAYGFLFCGPQSFILQNENVLDFVLVFLSIFSWSNSDTDKLQVLKMLKEKQRKLSII